MVVDPCREVTPLMEAKLEAYAAMDAAGEEWMNEMRSEVERDRGRLKEMGVTFLDQTVVDRQTTVGTSEDGYVQ